MFFPEIPEPKWIFDKPTHIADKTYVLGYMRWDDSHQRACFLIEKSRKGKRRHYFIGTGYHETPGYISASHGRPLVIVRLMRNLQLFELKSHRMVALYNFSMDYAGCFAVSKEFMVVNVFTDRDGHDDVQGREVYKIFDTEKKVWLRLTTVPDETKIGSKTELDAMLKNPKEVRKDDLPSERDRMKSIQRRVPAKQLSFGANPCLITGTGSCELNYDPASKTIHFKTISKNSIKEFKLKSSGGKWFYGFLADIPGGVRGFYEQGSHVNEFFYRNGKVSEITRMTSQDSGLLAYDANHVLVVHTKRWMVNSKKKHATTFLLIDLKSGNHSTIPAVDDIEKYENAARSERHDY